MFDLEPAYGMELSADIYLARDATACPLDPQTETMAPGFLRELSHLGSTADARALLEKLLDRPPQCLRYSLDLDQQKFSGMRSSVLNCGVIALAVQAGHRAVISAHSAQLPIAHWRAEFVFRAVSGIRLIQPELAQDEILHVVTRAIHFCSSPAEAATDFAVH